MSFSRIPTGSVLEGPPPVGSELSVRAIRMLNGTEG
jgi:hypothetical protein